MSRAARGRASVLACALGLVACASSPPPAAQAGPVGADGLSRTPVDFSFDSLDDRPVTSEATRGKPTVLVFVQTGSVWCQAQVNFLVAMAKNDGERTNYALVALEPRDARELVERYRQVLGVTFPAAIADKVTAYGAGPFEVAKVPTVVVLDRAGRVAWRGEGRVVKADELRAHLAGL